MTTLNAYIIGVSLWGSGLEGWEASRAVLAGAVPYEPRPSPQPPPAALAAAERRRSGPVVRLAMAVAEEAAAHSRMQPSELRSVFASSNGDGPVVGAILESLVTLGAEERPVSPTLFHNSVHNAAAGYWSIAHSNAQAATSIGLHDDTWAAALLMTMAEVVADQVPILLCAYDHPLPPPLDRKRSTLAPFGLGLVLAPPGIGVAMARLSVRFDAQQPSTFPQPRVVGLRALASGNAMARGLLLMEPLARGKADSHVLPYLDGALTVRVTP